MSTTPHSVWWMWSWRCDDKTLCSRTVISENTLIRQCTIIGGTNEIIRCLLITWWLRCHNSSFDCFDCNSKDIAQNWKCPRCIVTDGYCTLLGTITGLTDWVRLNVAHIGHIGDCFLRVKWPNQQCQSTEGRKVQRIRLQSHQVHPTVLTLIQQLCSMKHKNTNKSTHSEMGPVRQNPIQRTVRTAHLSVLMTVHHFSTQYNTEQFW